MGKIQRMSEAEKQIMEYIWSANRPVTTREILANLSKENNWKQNTVITFLTRLRKKGILKAKRVGKANYYEPCLSKQEYKSFETKQFIKDIYDGSVYGLINCLYESKALTKEDIQELMKRLDDQE